MKVYLVYQIYTYWDDEPKEDLDKIFKNEDDENFRVEEWEVK